MIFQLTDEIIFPSPHYSESNGLLAVGGDLSTERLIMAYSEGIFPWFDPDDDILWWSPEERPVFYPGNIKVSKSLKKVIRDKKFEISFDKDFEGVIMNCAKVKRSGEPGTWLSNEMQEAYLKLHKLGYAHSAETWYKGELVGGLYGISIGKAFFGESMFFKEANASKVALYYLSELLKARDFTFIDAQVSNPHLLSMGAKEINRDEFLIMLHQAVSEESYLGNWGKGIDEINSLV